jgi:hypothetical protein
VGVERLQAAGGSLQQLVHQQQQLALEFRIVLLASDDLLELDQQLGQHVLGIADHQGADGGADDDEQLDGLPDGADGAAHEGEAAEDRAEHDEDAENLHDVVTFMFRPGPARLSSSPAHFC